MQNVYQALEKLFQPGTGAQPEDEFIVTITDQFIQVAHPRVEVCTINWQDIGEIKLINTNEGPRLPDIWLALIGEQSHCIVPHGARGFDEVFDIISRYTGFDMENFGKSMTCTHSAEFSLWKKNQMPLA